MKTTVFLLDIQVKRIVAAAVFLAVGYLFWFYGAMHSTLLNEELVRQKQYVMNIKETRAPNYKEEKELAESYWARYPDIRKDIFFGKKSALGIQGPRDHYMNYGKKEGRIWKVIAKNSNKIEELKFAEAYWVRYPDVAASKIWGRKGALGIYGPRDHFELFGQKEGRRWGHENNLNESK